MLKKLSFLTMLLAAVFMFANVAISGDEVKTKSGDDVKAKHAFVGAKKCKICHKKSGIHASWLETKHAKAWDMLSDEQKKKEDCVKCHSTGTTAKGVFLEGVQCEACHGAGADYKKKSIMQDREKAVAAGLIMPEAKDCLVCHENVPEEFRAKEKFDYEKMKGTGIHVIPSKTEKTEKK